MDRSEARRTVALGIVVFVATLLVLGGSAAILRPGGSASVAPSSASTPGSSATIRPSAAAAPRPPKRRRCSPPRPRARAGTRSWSAPATSRAATRTATRPRRRCSTGSMARSSRRATTPIRTGRRQDFRECYDAEMGPAPGADPAGPRQPRLGDRQPRWLPRLLRGGGRRPDGGTRGTPTSSGRGTSSSSIRICAHVDGCGPDSRQGRWLATDLAAHAARCTAGDLAPPAVQLRGITATTRASDPSGGPSTRPARTSSSTATTTTTSASHRRTPTARRIATRGMREFVVGHRRSAAARLRGPGPRTASSAWRWPRRHRLHPPGRRAIDWQRLPTDGDVDETDGTAPAATDRPISRRRPRAARARSAGVEAFASSRSKCSPA